MRPGRRGMCASLAMAGGLALNAQSDIRGGKDHALVRGTRDKRANRTSDHDTGR